MFNLYVWLVGGALRTIVPVDEILGVADKQPFIVVRAAMFTYAMLLFIDYLPKTIE